MNDICKLNGEVNSVICDIGLVSTTYTYMGKLESAMFHFLFQ